MQASKMVALAVALMVTVFLDMTEPSAFAIEAKSNGLSAVISDPEQLANISNSMPDVAAFPTPKDVNQEATLDAFYVGLKGILLFRYDLAEEQFLRVQGLKPLFGMAYWGQAMCQMRFFWGEKNSVKACQIFQKMEAIKAVVTSNNTFYVEAAKTLFGCNNILTEAERLNKYANILKDGILKYPQNLLIKTFYAQSLMELAASFSTPQMVEARGLVNRVLENNPKHPLAMHLFLRALDTPELAPQALQLARVFPKLAYGPSVAPHMSAHIYIQLGLWRQAMLNDREALTRAEDFAKKYKDNSLSFNADNRYRAMEFLHYELLQLGNYKEAKRLLDQMISVTSVLNSVKYLQWRYKMAARQWLETRLFNTDVLSAIAPMTENTLSSANAESGYLLAYGLSLLTKSRDPAKIIKVQGLISRLADISTKVKPLSIFLSQAADVMKYELLAQLEVSRGSVIKQRYLKAFGIMEKAIQIQENMIASPRDPIILFVPSWEFFGQMVLSSGTKEIQLLDKAIACFQRSLEKRPKRSLSLLGLARAHELRGDHAKAIAIYRELREHWNPIRP